LKIFRKYLLRRRKQVLITYQILFTIRITFVIGCRSSCQGEVVTLFQTRCSRNPNLSFQFTFVSITSGPVQYTLIYIGITFTSMLNKFFFIILFSLLSPSSVHYFGWWYYNNNDDSTNKCNFDNIDEF
jgi:hypothetical protein